MSDRDVGCEVRIRVLDVLADPLGQLVALRKFVFFVISFRAVRISGRRLPTLSCLAKRCEGKEDLAACCGTRKEPPTDLVGKDHEPVVGLSAQYSSDALGGMSHRVKGEKVVLADPVRVAEELEASLQDARFGVLADRDRGSVSGRPRRTKGPRT